MIVACPSCSTTYRHPPRPPGIAGRCTRCDHVFPLPSARLYRVVPASRRSAAEPAHVLTGSAFPETGPRRMTFGMDDPRLAESLHHTALDPGVDPSRSPLTYWVVADERPPASPTRAPEDRPSAGSSAPAPRAPDFAFVQSSVSSRTQPSLVGALTGAAAGLVLAAYDVWPSWIGAAGLGVSGGLAGWGWARWKARSR